MKGFEASVWRASGGISTDLDIIDGGLNGVVWAKVPGDVEQS